MHMNDLCYLLLSLPLAHVQLYSLSVQSCLFKSLGVLFHELLGGTAQQLLCQGTDQ